MQTDYSDQSRHQWRHFSKSLRGGGLSNHWRPLGVSVYVTYCSCSSNAVSKVRFAWKNIKIIFFGGRWYS